MTDHVDDPGSRALRRELHPMTIERIELVDRDDGRAAVLVWTAGRGDHVTIEFDNRNSARAYCRKIWTARQNVLDELTRASND